MSHPLLRAGVVLLLRAGGGLAAVSAPISRSVGAKGAVEALNGPHGDGAIYDLEGPWAHLSPGEFVAQVLMPPREAPTTALRAARRRPIGPELETIAQLPESFDWSERGVVAPVRDQGALGSCWAISTAETVEGRLALSTGKLTPMSAEQLIECDSGVDMHCGGEGPKSGTLGCAECGMFGGWPYLAYQYLQKAGGMFSEDQWPYQHDGVYPCMPEGYDREQCGDHSDLYCKRNTTKGQGAGGLCSARNGFAARVTGWKALSDNETELAAQLVQEGPLSVLLEASSLQFYRSGIYKGGLSGCKPDPDRGVLGLDHAVLLVGYGVEHGLTGAVPYWKVKNSWGKKWGENGFFRILRGAGMCGISLAATTAEVTPGDGMRNTF
eukprot:CAMPEP_0176049082 /NCGR_PEP_ID=MMETSP0120_2-20121206/24386_1 /TAXON_ID=160619 /ORGANISM="Kryptoperidinium foliaceum, Strain CCMP 1326" /LENGTH=380 /DNA_ID=CAMNT_0017382505 /DNA_START=45 /DNA_END=1184 /DNA_ORIENTATION=+